MTNSNKRRMRLLFFVREPFPTSRVDVEVLFGKQLLGRGHEIDFVVQAADPQLTPGRHAWRGRHVFVGRTDTADGFWHRLRKHWLSLQHDISCLRLIRPTVYDAAQVRDKFLVAALAVVIARVRGMKFFYWMSFPESQSQLQRARDGSARYPALAWLRGHSSGWLLYRWILPLSTHVFVQSQKMKQDVHAHGVNLEKITAVPMGVDRAEFTAALKPSVSQAGDFVVGYLGVLSIERKLGVLIDMLAQLRRRGLAARLLVVGDAQHPRERAEIEKHAERLQVTPWLEITGFLPRKEALARIQAADVCLSPIFPTPIFLPASPTKLVEYLALGLPVVANYHPEQRLVLAASRAGLCVPWGAHHFARAVAHLMRCDSAKRAAMGARGRAWVEAHRTYERIADLVECRYIETLAPRSPAPQGA